MPDSIDDALERYQSINTLDDVNGLLGTLEGYSLDFKEAATISSRGLSPDDKKNYAKAASGFANEEGGILVWGIRCRPDPDTGVDIASQLRPIKNVMGFVSALNALAIDATDPPIRGMRNKPILLSEGENKGFVITYIPKGEDLAYKARLGVNDFFGRSASNFVVLSTHQIKRLMLSVSRPQIDVVHRIEQAGHSGGPEGIVYHGRIIFSILNTGKTITTHPYLNIKCLSPGAWLIKSVYEYSRAKPLDRLPGGAYVGGVDSACHPNVPVDVITVGYDLNQRLEASLTDSIKFDVSYAAMNFPVQHEMIEITHKEMSDVWGVDICRAEPPRF